MLLHTRVTHVSWHVGSHGIISPICELTTLKSPFKVVKISLGSYANMLKQNIYINDYVDIYNMDGKWRIERIHSDKRLSTARQATPPSKCPVCGGNVHEYSEGNFFSCISRLSCFAQLRTTIANYCSKRGVWVDRVGPVWVDRMVDIGVINHLLDLYSLEDNYDMMVNYPNTTAEFVERVIDSLRNNKGIGMTRFINALTIPTVGIRHANHITDRYTHPYQLYGVEVEELMTIPTIGKYTAEAISAFFADESNINVINSLISKGVL